MKRLLSRYTVLPSGGRAFNDIGMRQDAALPGLGLPMFRKIGSKNMLLRANSFAICLF